MRDLTEEFFAACRTWCGESGNDERGISGFFLVFTGGWRSAGTQDSWLNEGIDSEPTLDLLREWYEHLQALTGISDLFLTHASAKFWEAQLVNSVEFYGGEKEHYRGIQADFWDMMGREGESSESIRQLAGAIAELDPATIGSLQELRDRVETLRLWRVLMRDVFSWTRFSSSF